MPKKKSAQVSSKDAASNKETVSWQAQKSAMTRDRILEAAIDCFVNLGRFR